MVWSSLPESQMRAVLMIVADIFGEQSLQMVFVRGDDVIQQVTAATLDPALRDQLATSAAKVVQTISWPIQSQRFRQAVDSLLNV